jgi:hypothetical protein
VCVEQFFFAASARTRERQRPENFAACAHRHQKKYVELKMVEFSEFKGNKVIILKRDENDKYPFSFGLSKAKLILEHLEDIKKFVGKIEREKITTEKNVVDDENIIAGQGDETAADGDDTTIE